MAAIKERMNNMDLRWDMGFFTSQGEYVQQRQQLQDELRALRPIDYDTYEEAADMIANFSDYWKKCGQLANPEDARQQLIQRIVERVYVNDGVVVGVSLYGDYSVVLGHNESSPGEIVGWLSEEIKKAGKVTMSVSSQFGSDGHGSLSRCVILTAQESYAAVMRVLLEQ